MSRKKNKIEFNNGDTHQKRMNKIEHQDNDKHDFENEYEKYVQECKETTDLDLYRSLYFLIKMIHVNFQKNDHQFKTPFLCRNCNIILTTR